MSLKPLFIAALFYFASLAEAAPASAIELKTGDILLQSVQCYVCAMIELEEKSPYSHMGIVVVEGQSISVLESWRKVEKVSLRDFLGRRKPHSQTQVIRPRAFESFNARISAKSLIQFFDRWFAGKRYDHSFSWTNSDELGEMYYCSEFVAKFINHFLPQKIETKPMHFQEYRKEWTAYFRGPPPDGQPGISPGDFERSPLFRPVGILEE